MSACARRPSVILSACGAIAAVIMAIGVPLIFMRTLAAQNTASLPAAWTHWKYFRAIHLDETSAERLVSVVVPQDVYRRSADRLADLRVTDDRGEEVPYLLEARYGTELTKRGVCRIMESSFVPGEYTQIVCDAGANTVFHNGIMLNTPDDNFMAWVETDVSDDAREWRIVDDRSPIYEFEERNLKGVNTLHYGDTSARYIRVRIFLGDRKFPVTSAAILHQSSEQRESVPLDAILTPQSQRIAGESIWQADLGNSPPPVDEVRIETTQPEFSRRASVQASNDGENWYYGGSSDVYRFRQGDTRREVLNISLSDEWAPYLRLHIVDGNDSPLENVRVALYMTPRRIVFRQEPGRKYSLLYGQSEAKPPQYDISQTVSLKQESTAQAGEGVGAEEVNSAWSDPRPWTDRHESVLWIAAILAATLLALMALRSLRSTGPPET